MRIDRLYFLLVVLMAASSAHAQRIADEAYRERLVDLLDRNIAWVDVPAAAALADVVWLDAREREEYDVSHLPGARWVGYDDFDMSRMKDIPKGARIVVYCSVGYRSGKITERLRKAGYTNAYNLYGGIFEWVNTDHGVVEGATPTDRVHAYDRDWGRWLHKGIKVY